MKKPAISKKLLNKRIPTIIGMLVLVVALVAGIFLLGDGPGVFAPRATPSTTPKKIKVTNVTDNSFTVSFLTDEKTPGFVKYGTKETALKSQASDDRDQLSGTVSDYSVHHITVRGLKPSTTYYYTLGTGSKARFDNNGKPFVVKTTARNGAPAAAKTIYGSVSHQSGSPAEGSIVYVTLSNAGEMSSLVKSSGSWAIPLSNARTKDGSKYAQVNDTDNIIINVQGPKLSDVISLNTTVSEAQPVPNLVFGKANNLAATNNEAKKQTNQNLEDTKTNNSSEAPETKSTDPYADNYSKKAPTEKSEIKELSQPLNSTDSAKDPEPKPSPEPTVEPTTVTSKDTIDLSSETVQTVESSQPIIKGKVEPGVEISIEVHSNTTIKESVTADDSGNFTLDISTLSQTLEPGPHQVTYSYTDPNTGETVTKTVNFVVKDPAVEQLAQAQPYGSGNPYPPEAVPDTTSTPETTTSAELQSLSEASSSSTATDTATATDEGRTNVIATTEALPVSGSVETTMALVFGGLFFIIAGLWSFWISNQLNKAEIDF